MFTRPFTAPTARRSSWRPTAAKASTGTSRPAICSPSRAMVHIGPGAPPIDISLDDVIPPIKPEPDTKYIRHIRIQSALLTKFWGRPIYLSAIVLVPEGFDAHPNAHYPLDRFPRPFRIRVQRLPRNSARPQSEARLLGPLSSRRLQPHPAAGGVQELPGLDRARNRHAC